MTGRARGYGQSAGCGLSTPRRLPPPAGAPSDRLSRGAEPGFAADPRRHQPSPELTGQAGAISEGFGDYWAVTVADVVSKSLGVPEREPLPCVADWDSTSYTSTVPHCLRRVDTNLHYPDDLNGEVHHDGQIWSRALWDIRQALGNVKADTIILQGSFDFPGTTMPDLANRTVAAAQQLYGTAAAKAVQTAFADRGIL